jgi:hypothetical protein
MQFFEIRQRFSKKNTKKWLWVAAIIIVAAGLLTHITRQPYGELVVLLYGIAALFMRISSRKLFLLALTFLLVVPIAILVIGKQSNVSSSFASYAFTLFVTGVVAVMLELHRAIQVLRK